MSLDGAYDDANIFAKILRGEAPAAKVFEDDQVFAFMDVFPQGRGHVLVISKQSKALIQELERPQSNGKKIANVMEKLDKALTDFQGDQLEIGKEMGIQNEEHSQ